MSFSLLNVHPCCAVHFLSRLHFHLCPMLSHLSLSLLLLSRAMFSLRNRGGEAAALALASAFAGEDNALFKHEVGFWKDGHKFVCGRVMGRLVFGSAPTVLLVARRLECGV